MCAERYDGGLEFARTIRGMFASFHSRFRFSVRLLASLLLGIYFYCIQSIKCMYELSGLCVRKINKHVLWRCRMNISQ